MEEINQLKRDGLSILAISNLTGYDRKTIRKYLREPEVRPVYGPRPASASKLAPFDHTCESACSPGFGMRECCLGNCVPATTPAATRS